MFVLALFSEQLWLLNGQVDDATVGNFFHPLDGTEHGSPPSLTTHDRELASVIEIRIEPDLFALVSGGDDVGGGGAVRVRFQGNRTRDLRLHSPLPTPPRAVNISYIHHRVVGPPPYQLHHGL